MRSLESLSLPQIPGEVHDDHDRQRQVSLEEALDAAFDSDGEDGDPKLGDEHHHDEYQRAPGAPDATGGLEGDLVDVMALDAPSLAEADVREADGTPSEQS